MLKILQARLQQYVNRELPDVQAGFRQGRGTRDQIANIRWIIEKAREFQKIIYFCFIDYAKAFDCVDPSSFQFCKESQCWHLLLIPSVKWQSDFANPSDGILGLKEVFRLTSHPGYADSYVVWTGGLPGTH